LRTMPQVCQVIPNEAVEAAQAVMVAHLHGITLDEAEHDVWGPERWEVREYAERIVEAAARHL